MKTNTSTVARVKITREPLELIRHAQSECHTWFNVNSKGSEEPHPIKQTRNTQALCLQCICLVDESWTSGS
ncbi:hypothetical protein Bca4012_090003 [Brassica carinata]